MNIADIDFENPLLLCSGVLGISSKLFEKIQSYGAGGIVTKSISLEPNEGYKNPTVFELPYGILNSMGLPNPGADVFIEEIKERNLKIPLIVSIFGEGRKEYALLAKKIGRYCNAIELNLSCPHAGNLLSIGQDPDLVRKVVKDVKKVSSVPVIAKLTPNVSNIKEIGVQAQKGGADAVCAINTLKSMAINIKQEYPVLSNIFGGLSGPAIRPVGVRCVWELKEVLDIPIIGVGGISNWKDVVEYMYAGASAVQIGTAIGWGGLEVFSVMKKGLDNFCKKNKTTYEDLVGKVRSKFD
ncbi:MAG: dihydroorotate dehydrogenase [Candidatus Methanofastidiosia archaeon]